MQTASSSAEPLSAPECTVEVVSSIDAFLELETVWDALVEEAGIDHPFLSHEWVRTWWRAFGAGKELCILIVKFDRQIVAIAPLMSGFARIYGLKLRKLEFIANVHTPRCDLIVGRHATEAYRAVWNWLVAHKKQWDVLQLNCLPSESKTLKQLPQLAPTDQFLAATWHGEDCPYVEFTEGWTAYLSRLSSHHRAQMRNHLNRLSRLGTVRLEVVDARGDVEAALADGLQIEAAAWKAKAGTAILCRPDLTRFYSEIAREAARLGILRLLFLSVGGKRIAFAYGLCYKNKLYVLKTGYEPEYAAYSPYNLLCYLLFQDACERGLAEYEFLGASNPWKLHWTRQTKSHDWLYIFQKKLRTSLIHAAKFRLVPGLRRRPFYVVIRKIGLNIAARFTVLVANINHSDSTMAGSGPS